MARLSDNPVVWALLVGGALAVVGVALNSTALLALGAVISLGGILMGVVYAAKR